MDHAGFLEAIRRAPDDPAPRLIYADWLDDCGDARAELIRLEERLRELPVFGDEYWYLKPRRDEWRDTAPPDWVRALGYYLPWPAFGHGWPDDWRGRWRVLRVFVENWETEALPDVGAWGDPVWEAERRLGREMPPSLREFVAVEHLAQWAENGVWGEWFPFLSPLADLDAVLVRDESSSHSLEAVRLADFDRPDPPVSRFIRNGFSGDWAFDTLGSPLSEWCRDLLFDTPFHGASQLDASPDPQAREALSRWFGGLKPLGELMLGERPGACATFGPGQLRGEASMRATVSPALADADVPPELWELCRRRHVASTGVFEAERDRWRAANPNARF